MVLSSLEAPLALWSWTLKFVISACDLKSSAQNICSIFWHSRRLYILDLFLFPLFGQYFLALS